MDSLANRPSKLAFAVNPNTYEIQPLRVWSCAPASPDFWFAPEIGSSRFGDQLFDKQEDAKARRRHLLTQKRDQALNDYVTYSRLLEAI